MKREIRASREINSPKAAITLIAGFIHLNPANKKPRFVYSLLVIFRSMIANPNWKVSQTQIARNAKIRVKILVVAGFAPFIAILIAGERTRKEASVSMIDIRNKEYIILPKF